MLYPLTFHPILKERVWGGRNLERLYHKPLPSPTPYGESWEITDRPEGISVVNHGPLAGKDLRWLMQQHGKDLLGRSWPATVQGEFAPRFPLLVKILDAREKLSLQVHPPAREAARLGGEPKSEMWYVADATPPADIFVGLKRGVTRAQFEQQLKDGTVADCFHRIEVQPGDTIFLPSGRVHALGAGNVIFEIQQNSDTTYRVFDWNRLGLDGKPRELHLEQALESIDFADFEPSLITPRQKHGPGGCLVRELTRNDCFTAQQIEFTRSTALPVETHQQAVVLGVTAGCLRVEHAHSSVELHAGQFSLLPASLGLVNVHGEEGTAFLQASPV